MTSREEKLAIALAHIDCDAYVSGNPVDITYFTGSEETSGIVLLQPGQRPVLFVGLSGALHAAETAPGAEIVSYSLEDHYETSLTQLLNTRNTPRVASGRVSPPIARVLHDIVGMSVTEAPELSARLRRCKEPEEVELLRLTAGIADAATAAAMRSIRIGASELDAAAALEATARRMGCTGAMSPAQVKGGERTWFADAPAGDRAFQDGDLGFLDLGIKYRGYMGDMSRAFTIGEISIERQRLLETVDRVQLMVRTMVRPGVPCRDIDTEARRAFADAGYPDAFPHHLGHAMGLGDDVPRLVPTSDDVLEVGDVVTVEPGLYVRNVGGCRIEDVVVVRADENEILSKHPRVTVIPT